jgi:hypothetical protein
VNDVRLGVLDLLTSDGTRLGIRHPAFLPSSQSTGYLILRYQSTRCHIRGRARKSSVSVVLVATKGILDRLTRMAQFGDRSQGHVEQYADPPGLQRQVQLWSRLALAFVRQHASMIPASFWSTPYVTKTHVQAADRYDHPHP